jgi:hypothetical protein
MAAMMNVLMATSRALSGLFDNDITGLVSVERASLQKSSRKKTADAGEASAQ